MLPDFKDCTPFTNPVFVDALPNGISQLCGKLRAVATAAKNGRMVVSNQTSLQYLLTSDDDLASLETLVLTLPDDDDPLVYVYFLDGSPLDRFAAKIFGRWAEIPFHMIDLYTATESKPEGWEAWVESCIAQRETDEKREEFALLCETYNDTGHRDFPFAAWERKDELGYALGEY